MVEDASPVVAFDVGQTLAELDLEFLQQRLEERGARVDVASLDASLDQAWAAYDRASAEGQDGGHPWCTLMETLLRRAGLDEGQSAELSQWLWKEQPHKNLWRKPVSGVIEIARELEAAGYRVIVISNSEGRVAELLAELGWVDVFDAIADSGRLGVAKPAPEIFEWSCAQVGAGCHELIHIGDSWAADVEGALAVGARAIWFGGARGASGPREGALDRERVLLARDARELREALHSWGLDF